jgi:hypothetical protein
VHEQQDVTAGQISSVVTIPLNQARQLVLEVDYGRNLDVQDRLNWIQPALVVQSATTSSPATAPAAAEIRAPSIR